jgi:transposase InsO family protein
MKRMAIETIYRKPNMNNPTLGHKIYPYFLRKLQYDRPNQVWATDITSIPMARGFVYLTTVADWFRRRVLSWRGSITMEAEFRIEAVEEALAKHGTPDIFNTPMASGGRSLQHLVLEGNAGGRAPRIELYIGASADRRPHYSWHKPLRIGGKELFLAVDIHAPIGREHQIGAGLEHHREILIEAEIR